METNVDTHNNDRSIFYDENKRSTLNTMVLDNRCISKKSIVEMHCSKFEKAIEYIAWLIILSS
jgi:hypothetical protein